MINNTTRDFYYNITPPQNPAEIGMKANQVTGGLAGNGVLIIIWLVFFSMPHRRGYSSLACAISANTVTAAASLFLFPMKWINGQIYLLAIALSAAGIAYSKATKN